jgi:hypothetical protein
VRIGHGVGATGNLGSAAMQSDRLYGVTLGFITGTAGCVDGPVGLTQVGKHVDKRR